MSSYKKKKTASKLSSVFTDLADFGTSSFSCCTVVTSSSVDYRLPVGLWTTLSSPGIDNLGTIYT